MARILGRRSISLLLLCGTSMSVMGTEISLRYEDFYARLKVFHQADSQLLALTFSVPDRAGCQLQRAEIVTEQASFPLNYTVKQRLFLPYDENLKQQRAQVRLRVDGNAEQCGLAVQLRAKEVKSSYQQGELQQLYREMNQVQADLKGFPMKYFHHDIGGIQFYFPQQVTVTETGAQFQRHFDISGYWPLGYKELNQLQQLDFSQRPEVLSPWMAP
ncbi:hypothetical protein NFHSH190041_15680 [Shewanella sp. NFH-SH190041]|uniref:DUF2987 domain-containing protein n=1 Tax=Shewanella sp. NFH-SH190041 TaxID=2950245 RepID=UPI0021C3AADD|nr:DUF2987 domain-containing protein [Shewanella sp. NFH-SH190041]BDM64116.1 hypothetical protein NFHSH190041_15680 [Shewanella sp. NFH-SH190041]